MKYNVRNKMGQFAKQMQIVNGRLYRSKSLNLIVRAKRKCSNNFILVSVHKKLNGFLPPCDLEKISKEEVQTYVNA